MCPLCPSLRLSLGGPAGLFVLLSFFLILTWGCSSTERVEERGKAREKYINWMPPARAPTRAWVEEEPVTKVHALAWNRTRDPFIRPQDDALSVEPNQLGLFSLLDESVFFVV